MKVLIAYDGSESADLALRDLRKAGLPDVAEALVIVVAEVWIAPPPPSSFEIVEAAKTAQSPDELLDLCARDSPLINDSQELADRATNYLRAHFSRWIMETKVRCGSPASEIIKEADDWLPDLLVVGSHGRSPLGRLVMGSVSQKLVNYARCSVRVARGREGPDPTPVKIIIGTEGSPGAEAAIRTVAARNWPVHTEVRLVTSTAPFRDYWPSIRVTRQQIETMLAKAATELTTSGLIVSSLIDDTNPKQLLVTEASSWGADCIFVGAKGHPLLDRIFLGSVSAAISARAGCSVEIIRPSYC